MYANGWKADIAHPENSISFQPMDDAAPAQKSRLTKAGWTWLGVLLVCCLAGWIAEWFDRSTELTPSHDAPLTFGIYAACAIAILSALFILSQSRGVLYRRLVLSFVVAPIFALLGVFLLTAEVAALVETAVDFPAGKTRTFDGLLILSRAYQTHGKSQSWYIQTMPIWSNIDITKTDYDFMLGHRAPQDHGTDTDEITSNGYFCAKVTLQKSGEALRILHAGSYKLPAGSVVICSDAVAKNPELTVVT